MGSVSRTFALYTLRVTSQRDMQIALHIYALSVVGHFYQLLAEEGSVCFLP